MRKHRTTWIIVLALVASIGFASTTHATTGIVRVTVAKSGFVVSAGAGKGVLTFRHRNCPFTVRGLSFGLAVGASINELVGRADHIGELGGFSDTYSVVGARDDRGVQLKNVKGVIITLQDPRAASK